MVKRIKFMASGAAAGVGSFEPGDTAVVSDDLAKHLVDDMGSAEFVSGSVADDSPLGKDHMTKERRDEIAAERQASAKASKPARTETEPKHVSEHPPKKVTK